MSENCKFTNNVRFERIARQIIDLARKRREDYEANRGGLGVRLYGEVRRSAFGAALKNTLTALSPEDGRKVEVVMYAGRDGDDIHRTSKHLPKDNHLVTVNMIASKIPFDKYLEAGLAIAKRDRVDLDAAF